MRSRPRRIATLLALTAAASVFARSPQAPSNDLPQPYRTTRDWGELPPGVKWAAVTAVEPAPDGTIYVVHRCFANSCAGRAEAPILKCNASGTLLASWGQGMFIFPHGATVDRDGNLWVTDARGQNGKGHQVFKFDPRGNVLMTLGTAGLSGSGSDLFDQPTDVVVSPAGDIFVTDSHRDGKNNRVVKFTKDGRFVKEWGKKGSGPGELSEPHTIAMDSRGRLFVGDRENNRIQIFDENGRSLDEWRQFGRPSGIFIRNDTIYVADSESGPDTGAHELPGIKKGIRIGNVTDGQVTAFIEDMESTAPDHSGAEGVGVDAQGNVYGAVVRRQMLERHVLATSAAVIGAASQSRRVAPVTGTAIRIDAVAVPLNPRSPAETTIGDFRYAGGLALTSRETGQLHSLSDLLVTGTDRLTAVGDEGILLEARLILDGAGRLVGVADARISPLIGEDGRPLLKKAEADAEGVARLPNGDRLVSFEQHHRIWLYPASGGPPRPAPAPSVRLPLNHGMEALTAAPDAGRDAYMVGAEESGETWTCRLSTSRCVQGPTIDKPDAFGLVAMARLPGLQTAYLLRAFDATRGNRITLKIFRSTILVAQMDMALPMPIDNFEGLAAVPRADDGARFYLISDDNGSARQRTLLLAFDWRPR